MVLHDEHVLLQADNFKIQILRLRNQNSSLFFKYETQITHQHVVQLILLQTDLLNLILIKFICLGQHVLNLDRFVWNVFIVKPDLKLESLVQVILKAESVVQE